MIKRLVALCLIAVLALSAVPALAAEPEVCLSTQGFRVNGADVVCEKYNINGNNYFKLRDLAYLLRETENRFSVTYDEERREILLTPGGDYEPLGAELDVSRGDRSAAILPGTQPLCVNGETVQCEAYNFDGYNFYKLRDLEGILGFKVDWNPTRNAAVVESSDYAYVPAAGQWAYVTGSRCAVLEIERVDASGMTASLFRSRGMGDAKAERYEALSFVSTDGRVYETVESARPKMQIRFDGELAALEFLNGEEFSALLVCSASPAAARGETEQEDCYFSLSSDNVPVYGGTLRTGYVMTKAAYSEAEVQKILETRVLPLPFPLNAANPDGVKLSSASRVSDTEIKADDYRLIFEGDAWTLCDSDERYILAGTRAIACYFPTGTDEGFAYLDLLHVTVSDHTVTAAERLSAVPKAKHATGVMINGRMYARNTAWIDLSDADPAQAASLAAALRQLPQLQTVELMRADGTSAWDIYKVKTLQDAVPAANVHFSFTLYGMPLSTTETTEAYFDGVPIGDEGAPLISAAIDVLRACKRIVLDDCGISNEVMSAMRDAHPETKVVWRVHLGYANMLTDETMIRLTSRVNDTNSWVLHYCTDVVYLDLGHNSASEAKEGGMRDLSFMAYMPNLECVILSAAPCSDLSPLANCKKLVWLELANCYSLRDISVLADHPTLRYLNISHTSISDISMLDNVQLERFHSMENAVPYDQKVHFKETHPDCLTVFNDRRIGDYNADNWDYGYGWRYDSYLNVGSNQFWYYREMREIFHYDMIHWWNHRGA